VARRATPKRTRQAAAVKCKIQFSKYSIIIMDNTIKSEQLVPQLDKRKQFIENIKQWVLLDSQLKIVNEKTRKLRETKAELSDQICEYMDKNSLLDNKIGISDGELRIFQKKEYSPLSYGYIERSLAEIIPDKKQLEYIIGFLKERREITTSLDIKRTYNK
jgi:hypothetical protein